MENKLKKCNKCLDTKPVVDFYLTHGRPDSICKICSRERMKAWQSKNKAKQSVIRKQFRIQNRARLLLKDREWHEAHREELRIKGREYYNKNRDAILRAQKSRDPVKNAARKAVYGEVRSGRLKRPKSCEKCDNPKVEAHHHMGYDKENWLNVQWLCRKHHMDEHRTELDDMESLRMGAVK